MKAKKALPFVVSALALATGSALAAEIYVCDTGGDYTTIQAAVNAAAPWDTITVCPGQYNQIVTIPNTKDGLTVQSEEIATLGENTWVRGFKTVFAANEGPEYVTVQGFWIREVVAGSPCRIGIESSGNYATFAHNRLTDCRGQFGGDPAFRINRGVDGNNVHHNWIEGSGTGAAGLVIEGYCDQPENSGNCKPEGPGDNHNIHQNLIERISGDCMLLAGGTSYNNVHQNEIRQCGGDGIRFEYYNPSGPDEFDAESSNIHQNVVCDRINLPNNQTADNFVHHNFANVIACGSGNICKKNTTEPGCPLDEI